MPKLHQVIAIEKGAKTKAHSTLTEQYHVLQKTPLLSGIERVYTPKDEDGDKLPPESTRVQITVAASIKEVERVLVDLFDATLARESANQEAHADVIVDGVLLVEAAPVTYLLFLEKQLTDLRTFVSKLPTLDPADRWLFDEQLELYATEPVETVKTKKIPRVLELSPATREHPAQVQAYHEDVTAGYWRTIKFSGALPAAVVKAMAERVEKLQRAVKVAREEANALDVEPIDTVGPIFNYVFGDLA